jgi:hypothetical protein
MSRNLVISVYVNAAVDPERNQRLSADAARATSSLVDTVHSHGREVVILSDCAEGGPFVRVEPRPDANPYFHRWRLIRDYLAPRDDIARVFCVDATDVEMLADPFPHMEPGRLYIGSEVERLGTPFDGPAQKWYRRASPLFEPWVAKHAELPMLNCGLVGGEPGTIMRLIDDWLLLEALGGQRNDMAAFSFLMYERYADQFVTGHPVHTQYKAHQRTPGAWWKHK